MYNFNFLENIKNSNVIFLFHNETENVEGNIIDYIVSKISYDLVNMYPERNIEESLVVLQYPSLNSPEYIFNQFFDSPQCISLMFSTFKGIFVIDCSEYNNFDNIHLNNLIEYIKENSSSTFKFIVLMSQNCKERAKIRINEMYIKSVSFVDLEIDKSCLEELYKLICIDDAKYLMKQYEENKKFRWLSPLQIKDCILESVETKENLQKKISTIISNNHSERRIGF